MTLVVLIMLYWNGFKPYLLIFAAFINAARNRKECELDLTQKGEMVSRLQGKAEQIGKILNNIEKYNHFLGPDSDLLKALKSPTAHEHTLSEKLDKLKADKPAKSKDDGPPNKRINLQEIPPFRKSIHNDKSARDGA